MMRINHKTHHDIIHRIVYELIDPRDNLPFYVGQTYKHPARRLREHLNDAGDYFAGIADSESPKDARIVEIILAGLQPRIRVIAECNGTYTDIVALETEKISEYEAQGIKLYNAVSTKRGKRPI